MNQTLDSLSMQRYLEHFTAALPPELADRFVATPASPEFQVRLDELAEKANEGLLSEEERREYLTYVDAMDMMALLRAKLLADRRGKSGGDG